MSYRTVYRCDQCGAEINAFDFIHIRVGAPARYSGFRDYNNKGVHLCSVKCVADYAQAVVARLSLANDGSEQPETETVDSGT